MLKSPPIANLQTVGRYNIDKMIIRIIVILILQLSIINSHGQEIKRIDVEFSLAPGLTKWSEKYSSKNNGSGLLPLPNGNYRHTGPSISANLSTYFRVSKNRFGLFIAINKTNFDKIEYTRDTDVQKQIDSNLILYGLEYGYSLYQKGSLNFTPKLRLGTSIMRTKEDYIDFKNKFNAGVGITISKTINRFDILIIPSYNVLLYKEINKITYGIEREYIGNVNVLAIGVGLRVRV